MTDRLPVFARFCDLLSERFASGIHSTEDAVRYTFFHSLTTIGGYSHAQVAVEVPLQSFPGWLLDTVVYDSSGRAEWIIEFKYHRQLVSGNSRPVTQQAGSVFRDIFRLGHATKELGGAAYFVWIADPGTAAYFRRKGNRVPPLFDSAEGQTIEVGPGIVVDCSATFRESIGGCATATTISCVHSQALPGGDEMRAFRVAIATPRAASE